MSHAHELAFDSTVAAYRLSSADYPSHPPYHPGVSYPEYRWRLLGEANLVYEAVRGIFQLLGLDDSNYGTPAWNPLGAIVQPGDRVVIKPNFLRQHRRARPNEWEQVITHGSVIRAVTDYVLIALKGKGEIWITDGPQLDSNWDEIVSRTGVGSVCSFYRSVSSVPVHLLDLRKSQLDVRGDVTYGRTPLPGDPNGSTVIRLGKSSLLADHHGAGRYYGSDYDQAETNLYHTDGRHEYKISRTVAIADVFINLPKMKTHQKVGATLCLKNPVGITVERNRLPHYTDGDPSNGGDQFPNASMISKSERWGIRRLQRFALQHPNYFAPLLRIAKAIAVRIWGRTTETIRSGNWYGNDTAWRMVHDINRCLLYSDGDTFPSQRPKRYFALVDGVIAGDGNGPAEPDSYGAGVLTAGFNPVAVDCATARLMGFDPMKIVLFRESFTESHLPLAPFAYQEITLRSNRKEWQARITEIKDQDCYHFRPHFGWRGKIEWGGSADLVETGK